MISGIMIFAVEHDDTQQYRSGHNEHDWKSCVRQKRTESSNLSCCAKKDTTRKGGVFLRWEIRTGGERSEKTPLWGVCPPLCVSRHGSAASESLLLRQKGHHPKGWCFFAMGDSNRGRAKRENTPVGRLSPAVRVAARECRERISPAAPEPEALDFSRASGFFIALLGDHCDRSKSIRKEPDRVSAFYMSGLRRTLRCEPCPLTAGGARLPCQLNVRIPLCFHRNTERRPFCGNDAFRKNERQGEMSSFGD